MGGIQAFYPAQEVPLQIKNGFQIPGNEEKNSLERANKILECIKQMFNFFFFNWLFIYYKTLYIVSVDDFSLSKSSIFHFKAS